MLSLVSHALAQEYEPRVMVMHRDWTATASSQVRAGHSSTREEAEGKVRRAHEDIAGAMRPLGCFWWGVAYEALADPSARVSLAKQIGLPYPERLLDVHVDVRNAKHYPGLERGRGGL
jgi:hypothetical protein